MVDKKIIDMNNKEALNFFLKSESYCNLKLPNYFDFAPLLNKIHSDNPKKGLNDFCKSKYCAKYYDGINYEILINKSNQYSWRKITLTNPIAYVGIIHDICKEDNWNLLVERFNKFRKLDKIKCCSIPVESLSNTKDKREQILNWWSDFEQKTISEAMDFNYMMMTDISNFYPSIYTHTIPWALHGKEVIKEEFKNKSKTNRFGNDLDKDLEAISYGQTNGIPQGSVLYDFIAELILGYCDMLIAKEVSNHNITDYKIIRYRDDYRIFSNSSSELDIIFRIIIEVLLDFNLNINNSKTFKTNDIIGNSIKKDKLYGLLNPIDPNLNPQKKIMAIREVGNNYKNSGLLIRLLHSYYKDNLFDLKENPRHIEEITSIVIDIMINNPKVYPECIAILSKILSYSAKSTKSKYVEIIRKKVANEYNVDYLNIWLQRLSITGDIELSYPTKLCEKIYSTNQIWDTEWSNYNIDEQMIVNKEVLDTMKEIVTIEEIDDFLPIIY